MATVRKLSLRSLQLAFLSKALTSLLRLGTIGIVAGFVCYGEVGAQAAPSDAALTVEEVVKLSRSGFSEELIVTKIKKNGKAFDLSSDELVELKKQGLSDNLIRFLLDPTQPYTPPAPPAPAPSTTAAAVSAPAKKYPDDPFATLVPTDSGLYSFVGKTPYKVDLKVLLGIHKGKVLKGKVVAYLAGPYAKLRVKAGKNVFYLRLPEGKEVSDLILISLLEKDDRRELDGLPGPKGGLNADSVLPFDQVEVGPKLFKLTPPALAAGEYVFFLVGSAEPDKGTYGKGYDFGANAEPVEKKK
jgi:hypothetical protein